MLSSTAFSIEPGFHTLVITSRMWWPVCLFIIYFIIFVCSFFLTIKKKYIYSCVLFGCFLIFYIVYSLLS